MQAVLGMSYYFYSPSYNKLLLILASIKKLYRKEQVKQQSLLHRSHEWITFSPSWYRYAVGEKTKFPLH